MDKEILGRVIKGLECCTQPSCECAADCPYSNARHVRMSCCDVLMADALALLKAQEAMVDDKSQEVISGFTLYCSNCGFANTRCGTISPRGNTVFYCGKCGMEVK